MGKGLVPGPFWRGMIIPGPRSLLGMGVSKGVSTHGVNTFDLCGVDTYPPPKHQNKGDTYPSGMLSCYYHLQMKLWKGNVFTPVCQSFCSQGVCTVHARIYTPLSRPPRQTPPGQTPPCEDTLLSRHPTRRPLQRMVRILLECFLVAIKWT